MDPYTPSIDELQRRFETIAPAPRIANSLRALTAEGNVNPDEIIALIRLEPLLAARILREANQLPHARREGYGSIEEAATAVGFQRMYDLIGLYSYQGQRGESNYSTTAWKRAVTCAICMQSLAEKHQLDPHRAYAIGLLHSIASAILDPIETPPGTRTSSPSNGLSSLQHRLRRFNTSGLCYSLFREWQFPASFADPIRFQYSPLDCQSTGKMACLLNLAKWITGVVREIDELPDQDLGPDVLVLNLLGEGEQTLWNLVTEVSDSLHRADSILQGNCSAR